MNDFGHSLTTDDSIIETCYREHRQKILAYISYKLNNATIAEDLTQDVFLRIMECGQMIRPETVRSMLYTVARNIVIDHLRRQYYRYSSHQILDATMLDSKAAASNHSESSILAADIANLEKARMQVLPPQRRKIYNMVRFEEKNVAEIAKDMSLSVRTVENHLLIGRREVREYVRKCINY